MIAWEESGTGLPAVFVHGITEDRRGWDAVIPLLEDRLRCIRLDLRGHGESDDADDYGALAMVQDVATVVEEAGIAEPPLLVGHSLGAVVATAVASVHPCRGVVNIDQSLRLGDFAHQLQAVADDLRGPRFGDAVLEVFVGLGDDGVPDEERARLLRLHRAARPEVVLGVWDAVLDTPPDELTAQGEMVLGALQAPYLAIHGHDPGPGYEEWVRGVLPTATVEVWGSGGHYPHLADPERFAARVLAFLDAAA